MFMLATLQRVRVSLFDGIGPLTLVSVGTGFAAAKADGVAVVVVSCRSYLRGFAPVNDA